MRTLDRRTFLRVTIATCAGVGLPCGLQAERDKPATARILTAPITRQPVNSTSIAGIGYHAKLQVLEIAFHSGAVYRYEAVPSAVFESLMKAESKGRYFSRQIRDRFQFHRMEAARP